MVAKSPPWPPLLASQTYGLRSNLSSFTSPITGKVQRSIRNGARWEFNVSFTTINDDTAKAWTAFLAYCQDEALTFYWSPYPLGRAQNFPNGDGTASATCDSTVIKCDSTVIKCDASFTLNVTVGPANQTGGTITLYGLAAGNAFVAGDFVAFDNPLYRELHLITANATADGSGHITLSITPDIRRSPVAGASAYFDGHAALASRRCACEVYVADNSQAAFASAGYQSTVAFKLIEAVR